MSRRSPTARSRRWSPAAASCGGCQVCELRVPLLERELFGARRSVAVLGEDELRDARRVGLLGVVVLVAIHEHHEVGVLLDRAGLSQVGEDRALVVALLDGA